MIDILDHIFRRFGIISSMGLVNSREHIESLLNAQDLNVASIQEFLEKQGNNERTLYKQA